MKESAYGTRVVVTEREGVNAFVVGVYMWMFTGVGLTGLIAFLMSAMGYVQPLVNNQTLFIGTLIAEVALVFYLSARVEKMSALKATWSFIIYACLNGVTLSVIFLVYTEVSIASTFIICSAMFAVMSIYGFVTKKDLTSFGSFLIMGLVGIIIAMIVNMFLASPQIDFLVSGIGVLIFTGLTAYDTQKIKELGAYIGPHADSSYVRKSAIMGALPLYLDFINLLLMLLRLIGRGSKD